MVRVTVAVYLVHSKLVWSACSLLCCFSCSYRILRNSSLNRLHILQARHKTTQLMSKLMRSMLLMSQLKRSIRPSRTQAPAFQTVVTSLCALLLVVSLAMASLAPACQPVHVLRSNNSFASWPHRSPVRMSSLPYSPAVWQTCRKSFVISPTLPPARRSGCAHMNDIDKSLVIARVTGRLAVSIGLFSGNAESLVQTGPCQRLQDQRAPAPTCVLPKAPLLARVEGGPLPLGKRQKPTFLPAQPALGAQFWSISIVGKTKPR